MSVRELYDAVNEQTQGQVIKVKSGDQLMEISRQRYIESNTWYVFVADAQTRV